MSNFTVERIIDDRDLSVVHRIRRTVFTEGQSVPEERDVDGLDDQAVHYLGVFKGKPVATARARLLEEDRVAKIERVAVLSEYRGWGFGLKLMEFMIEDLGALGVLKATLESQVHATSFYERLGFIAFGDTFMDANIPHVKMTRSLG